MIIVVSDVHLGYDDKCNSPDFMRFLDRCNSADIDHLVLLGDILDFWRRNNAEIVKDNADILGMLASMKAKHTHYVVGNHDYYMLKLGLRYGDKFPFSISKNLRLEENESKFYFTHGYELEVYSNLEPLNIENYEGFSDQMCFNDDFLGGYVSKLWDILKRHNLSWKLDMLKKPPEDREKIDKIKELALSKGKYVLLGMKPDEKFVYGHTHKPFVSADGTVANTGSWIIDRSRGRAHNTYLKITGGDMELREFDVDSFP